jgi:hypothetical protein
MYYDILSRYEAPYRPFSESSMGNGSAAASPAQSGPGIKR